ncbi:Cu+-exporting ATPase [Reichenbachiella faecimaris]|uniref:Cu+-exporting ATPase n=1 Tax=Reichenbachiella faecimaris TaxID=692418 RepID=A0A1W2G6M7_REIFA|nr:heavy metal translocating P-type ATPase metal-binding domain-containing protein [Reichenbachiella faecimaris]SMD31956.1 Cu+-exporting ATPase [Reichenbachiella faecimaris]
MPQSATKDKTLCYHCGDDCNEKPIWYHAHSFCCYGCQTVFELLTENDLCDYYTFETNPGNQLSHFIKDKYLFLDNQEIVDHLLDFKSDQLAKITLSIPSIHCSSCIWLLENIQRFDHGIIQSKINFAKKKLAIDYNPTKTNLRKLADLLYQLSYEPEISLDQKKDIPADKNKSENLKIGIAGFCFGNIMLLAFPEYLGIEMDSEFINYFTYLSLGLSLPVLFYCSSIFFISAIAGIRKKFLNIDLPIAIGILVLFVRSLFEIFTGIGPGYLDSMSALVFFLLIGRWVQSKTYEGLAFDRDFKSYFPLAVQKIENELKESVLVSQLKINDLIEVRNEEIIPCDAVLVSKQAIIDYSFVSGESEPTAIDKGAQIYAGGRIKGTATQMIVTKAVSQSYLTQLWNHSSFDDPTGQSTPSLIDKVSQYFTPIILLIALTAGVYWFFMDSSKVLFVVSSVLIVACPCALALAAPFTLSSTMNTLGLQNMYLKGTHIIEKIWQIKRIVFDKTGTITTLSNEKIEWHGRKLSTIEKERIQVLASQSVHPLSVQLSNYLRDNKTNKEVLQFDEQKGQGISGVVDNCQMKIGSPDFVGLSISNIEGSIIGLKVDKAVLGYFLVRNGYRDGLKTMISQLENDYHFTVLSGDNDHEFSNLTSLFPENTPLIFNQTPADKLKVIQALEVKEKTMMVGDGLNDAGALKSSFIGVSVAEHRSSFTPASDIIILGNQLTQLPKFLTLIHHSKKIIMAGFLISFLYNVIGLSLAVAGFITPVIAAILMPLSSISVVALSTLGIKYLSHSLKLNA